MKVYLDASVLMRIVLRASEPLQEWRRIDTAVSSALLAVECFRTLHRIHQIDLSDDAFAEGVEDTNKALGDVELLDVSAAVLERASGFLPSQVKTLDAIHLATAMLWRERQDADLTFATHDKQLAVAGRALGFTVIGV